jgi:PIN domain nuclease of toxin-antitoxin system
LYLDANAFLAYVSNEIGRAGVVEELPRLAERQELVIITSTLSIAEVAFGAQEKIQGALDQSVEARID